MFGVPGRGRWLTGYGDAVGAPRDAQASPPTPNCCSDLCTDFLEGRCSLGGLPISSGAECCYGVSCDGLFLLASRAHRPALGHTGPVKSFCDHAHRRRPASSPWWSILRTILEALCSCCDRLLLRLRLWSASLVRRVLARKQSKIMWRSRISSVHPIFAVRTIYS